MPSNDPNTTVIHTKLTLDLPNGNSPLSILKTDIAFDTSAFLRTSTLPETRQLSEILIQKCKADTKWWECGAQEYRRRRGNGETPFPKPVTLEHVSEFSVSSKYGHKIPCRVFGSNEGSQKPRGVLYHIHGGGWVIGSAAGQDLLLEEISKRARLIVVSIEYRLAPEYPFPAAPEDCYELADWLVANSRKLWDCDLSFISGESAGATLSSLVLLHLRNTAAPCKILGIVLNYGCFDLSTLPSIRCLDPDRPLILSYEDVKHFIDAYLPGVSEEMRRNPEISPAYNKLDNLPPALFIVGTEDGLIDDTILMSGKWKVAGNDSVVKFIPGAPHGFMTFDATKFAITRQGWEIMVQFIDDKISSQEFSSSN